jgi:hypothetical protein
LVAIFFRDPCVVSVPGCELFWLSEAVDESWEKDAVKGEGISYVFGVMYTLDMKEKRKKREHEKEEKDTEK